jgi:hypothetical protein
MRECIGGTSNLTTVQTFCDASVQVLTMQCLD